eukprot:CAMPEP_0183769502 /NCGR_PEP_ID=MMETSP0739-20130205/22214_1 /TAXON_ID=385413 /ORGANISM="Thalassiosira miniscula, Strain CCMP1093" /LENGTH=31 /DNA_ID= /DNA_START= /DNA_END= /DNA_ORIENTATION=
MARFDKSWAVTHEMSECPILCENGSIMEFIL